MFDFLDQSSLKAKDGEEENNDFQFPNSGEHMEGLSQQKRRIYRHVVQNHDFQFPESNESGETVSMKKLSGYNLGFFYSQNRRYRHASSEETSAHSSEEISFTVNTVNLQARGCLDSTFCEGSNLYPESYVKNLLENNSKIPTRIVNKFVKE